ncbi:hypothetical protein U2I54_28430 [Bacillus pseudomycoides]|uniref:Uncharacterized protein n=1 Tax=Bacillus bingmayongensis TaxID=1150157 RepID=A0ABU5K538_9BACI|nr:hypothetical protein [Bacillus pseudomycoides]
MIEQLRNIGLSDLEVRCYLTLHEESNKIPMPIKSLTMLYVNAGFIVNVKFEIIKVKYIYVKRAL